MDDTQQPGSAPEMASTNRLAESSSLYLRQHADNPVHWQPWDDATLKTARTSGKLILLSIGYSSCHWCHVMAHEVFEDAEVADYLNEHFLCIKVDREDQPDIDAAYMEAMQLMSGGGGWPLNMFLLPDLLPFMGITYMPRTNFLALLQTIIKNWHEAPDKLKRAGQQLLDVLEQPLLGGTPGARLDEGLPGLGAAGAERGFDRDWGGYGEQQKFPMPPRLNFLLHYYRRMQPEHLDEMLRLTLDRMADGGLYDHIGGGFHRYTIDPAWTVPHFEKMLYDNAQLASLYLEAAVVFDNPRYRETATGTLDFMLREWRLDGGAFAASFDADTDGAEGSTYTWTRDELLKLAGEEEGKLLAEVLGVTTGGNFEGRSVITRRSHLSLHARKLGINMERARELFARWQPRLLEARNERPQPARDPKVVTAWNGMAIAALANGYRATGKPAYIAAATSTAEYLWEHHLAGEDGLWRSTVDGHGEHPAVLEDYAELIRGLLALFEAAGGDEYLWRAMALTDHVLAHFARPAGGFYQSADTADTPLTRRLEVRDGVEPSGIASMLHGLLKLADLSGNQSYAVLAGKTLAQFQPMLHKGLLELASWLDMQLLATEPRYTVVIAGDPEAEATASLRSVVDNLLSPAVSVLQVGANGAGERLAEMAPLAAGKQAREGQPVAYPCTGSECREPLAEPSALREVLLAEWQR